MQFTHAKRFFALVLSTILLLTTFASCTKKQGKIVDATFQENYTLGEQVEILPVDFRSQKKAFEGKDGDSIELHFKNPTKLNTIVLEENGDNILQFEIAIFDEEENKFETVYQQDKVGAYRYCAFPEEKTTVVKITITKTKQNAFALQDVDVLQVEHNEDAAQHLRVAAYVVVDSVLGQNKIDEKHLDVVTDMILFGAVTFDENGHLAFHDYTIDGKTIDGKAALQSVIAEIRENENGQNQSIYINLLGPDGDIDTKEQKHNIVFKENKDVLIGEIKALLDELHADGVYFDYEYPYKRSGWKTYSNFLVALREGLSENKKIGVALGPWGHCLSKKALEAVDYCEIMTYDLFDEDGYHATFESAVQGIDFANRMHIPVQKCDIGLPFYGRPTDKSAFWPSYASAAVALGKFGNIDTTPREYTTEEDGKQVTVIANENYYNGYQMIYDKTAYALDSGIGGIMIWHYACDVPMENELSLFRAIEEAIDDRCDD